MNAQDILNPDFIGDSFIEKILEETNDLHPIVNVHYLSDNGGYSDTAKTEIRKRLSDINARLSQVFDQESPPTEYHDIPAQDWRAGAFDLAQIARDTVRGVGNVIFLNCAPRKKERGLKRDNEGEGVFIGMLRNGTIISAVSEDSFALFKDLVAKGDLEIYRADVQIKGSQFRSRDFFPWLSQMIGHSLKKNHEGWEEDLSVSQRKQFLKRLNFISTDQVLNLHSIPDFKQAHCVLRADCHGNLKLSLRENDVGDIPQNTPLRIQVGDINEIAVLKQGMFDPNEISPLGLAFGSSGRWPDSDEGAFLELALLGKSLRAQWEISAQNLKDGVSVRIIGPADNTLSIATPASKLRHNGAMT